MDIEKRLNDIHAEIKSLMRYRHTLNLLHNIIIFAKQIQAEDDHEDVKMLLGDVDYLKQRRLFTLSLPRMSGKTTAFRELKESLDVEGVLFTREQFFSQYVFGKSEPFGTGIRVLVFDEKCSAKTISFIAENWLALGYDKFPSIVVIKTSNVAG